MSQHSIVLQSTSSAVVYSILLLEVGVNCLRDDDSITLNKESFWALYRTKLKVLQVEGGSQICKRVSQTCMAFIYLSFHKLMYKLW